MHRDPPYLIEKRPRNRVDDHHDSWELDPSESALVLTIITDNICGVNLEPLLITVRKYSEMQ